MAIDFTRYQTPGIYTEDIGGPQLRPRTSVPTAVAIFGLTRGYRTHFESLKVNPDVSEEVPAVNRTLAKKGIKTASLKVKNISTGQVYAENTDYTIVRVSVGDDVTAGTRDDLYTLSRVIDGGHIEPGDTIYVEYNYTDPDYHRVYNFYDYDDIREFYGEPFDTAGNIVSEVTLAAQFAITNGASTIMAVAVDPEDPETPTTGDYSDALDKLRDEDQIAIIVPATGNQALHALVQQHVSIQSENRYERRAVLGFDGTVTPITSSQRITAARTLFEKRVALVSPATFDYYAPELNRKIVIGGQFVAAALAGKSASMNAAWPLTHKVLRGILDVTEIQRDGEKNLEAQNGLMVVEKNKRSLIWVRHGVTTDPTDILTHEWSIIGQKDVMVYRIRDYLDADQLIGQPILPETIINTKASADSALQSLKRDKIIVDYRDLKVRQVELNPDVLEVRYQWRPTYPLNYIVVKYSVDSTTGEVTSNDAVL